MLVSVAAVAMVLGLLSRRVQQQRQSLSRLRELGGQLEVPPLDVMTLLTGMKVDNVRFLGPLIGDEDVPDIRDASAALGLNRISLMETNVSVDGFRALRSGLPSVEIQMISPVPTQQSQPR